MVQKLSPFERAWSLNNQVVLSVIDEHINFMFKQVLNQSYILHHEVNKESFIHVSTLGRIGDIGVEFKPALHIGISEELFEQQSWVLFVTGYVIYVDSSSKLDDQIQNLVECVVHLFVVSCSFLVGCIQDKSLDIGSLLVVDQSQVVGVLSDLSENEVRMSKTITNSDSFQSFQKSLVFSLLFLNLVSDSGGILSCITLPENEQRQISSDSYHREAAFGIIIQFIQGIVEVISDIIHIFAVRVRVVGISIAQSCAYGLVNKDYVVVFDPSIIILYYLVRGHGNGSDKVRTKLHEISKLTGRSRSSIEPDDSWESFEVIFGCTLFSIEDKGESRSCFSFYVEISAHDNSIVIVGRN